MVDRLQGLGLAFRIVLNHQLQRPQHGHSARRGAVEVLADRVVEHRHVHHRVGAGDADAADEVAQGRGRHAAAAQACQGGHARVIPAGHVAVAHQGGQDAFGQHGVADVQAGEFILLRAGGNAEPGDRQMVQQPFIQRAVILEFQGAQRMGDALDRVRLTVGEIVGGVDAPRGAGARVIGVQDAVQHRIAQVHVAGSHVDLGAQHAGAVGQLPGAHVAEQRQVLLGGTGAVGAVLARLGQGATRGAHLVGRGVVHIGVAVGDQVLRPGIELFEIVRRVMQVHAPVEAEPVHITLDGVDELLLLLGRVGVVEAQVAAAAEFVGDAEIQADGFGVPDVQVAVRLRRKAGDDAGHAVLREVVVDDVADEVAPRFLGRRVDGLGRRHVC